MEPFVRQQFDSFHHSFARFQIDGEGHRVACDARRQLHRHGSFQRFMLRRDDNQLDLVGALAFTVNERPVQIV